MIFESNSGSACTAETPFWRLALPSILTYSGTVLLIASFVLAMLVPLIPMYAMLLGWRVSCRYSDLRARRKAMLVQVLCVVLGFVLAIATLVAIDQLSARE